MAFQTWLLYCSAILILTLTPGPSVLACVTVSLQIGAARAFWCALGVITGVLGLMLASALSVGAVWALSTALFEFVKWLGVCYLLYLGLMTFFSPQSIALKATNLLPQQAQSAQALYVKGFLVGISNPKALLFLTAFFPQFINPAAPQLPQFLIMASTFAISEFTCLMFYANFASIFLPWLNTPGRGKLFNRLVGATFISAGLLMIRVEK